jgi:hypothetical protein
VTSYPLRAILHNPNTTGNIAKWAVELAEFELDFVPHHAGKSQELADFIVDWMPSAGPHGVQTIVSQSPELRSSLDPTGLSSLMAPHVSRGYCSSPHIGTNSSIWYTWTSKQPTTWKSTKPCSLG